MPSRWTVLTLDIGGYGHLIDTYEYEYEPRPNFLLEISIGALVNVKNMLALLAFPVKSMACKDTWCLTWAIHTISHVNWIEAGANFHRRLASQVSWAYWTLLIEGTHSTQHISIVGRLDWHSCVQGYLSPHTEPFNLSAVSLSQF